MLNGQADAQWLVDLICFKIWDCLQVRNTVVVQRDLAPRDLLVGARSRFYLIATRCTFKRACWPPLAFRSE